MALKASLPRATPPVDETDPETETAPDDQNVEATPADSTASDSDTENMTD
jgi:hypothetical protein